METVISDFYQNNNNTFIINKMCSWICDVILGLSDNVVLWAHGFTQILKHICGKIMSLVKYSNHICIPLIFLILICNLIFTWNTSGWKWIDGFWKFWSFLHTTNYFVAQLKFKDI